MISREDRRRSDRLNILHLMPSFAGGGAERQLALLAPELCRLGAEVHVAFARPGVNLELMKGSDVALHRIPNWGNHDPSIFLSVLALIRTLRPHVVQTWFRQMDVLGGLAAKMAGVPFVLSERSSAMAYPGTWKDQLRERIGRFAAAIIANSLGGMDYWRSRATNVRLQLIRNGIPIDRIQSVVAGDVKELGLPSETELIVFAGRLSPEKNLPTLIAAVEKVLGRRRGAVLLIFGEGPLRGFLEERIKESAFSQRIRWMGYAPDLWRWIRPARIFVSVSQFEGNPNAVLEAMAIGCPLVVSDIPAHREILDESSARFCGTDVEEIAAAIEEVFADPPSASARAVAARSRAQGWSIEVTARQYLQLYEMLASQSKMAR